jgi:hypothetical protein
MVPIGGAIQISTLLRTAGAIGARIVCLTVRQWPERLGHWAYQLLDREGTPRAGSRT